MEEDKIFNGVLQVSVEDHTDLNNSIKIACTGIVLFQCIISSNLFLNLKEPIRDEHVCYYTWKDQETAQV